MFAAQTMLVSNWLCPTVVRYPRPAVEPMNSATMAACRARPTMILAEVMIHTAAAR